MDYNREVRRATHDTMNNLVTAVGFEHFCVLLPFVFSCLLVLYKTCFLEIYEFKEELCVVLYILLVMSWRIHCIGLLMYWLIVSIF